MGPAPPKATECGVAWVEPCSTETTRSARVIYVHDLDHGRGVEARSRPRTGMSSSPSGRRRGADRAGGSHPSRSARRRRGRSTRAPGRPPRSRGRPVASRPRHARDAPAAAPTVCTRKVGSARGAADDALVLAPRLASRPGRRPSTCRPCRRKGRSRIRRARRSAPRRRPPRLGRRGARTPRARPPRRGLARPPEEHNVGHEASRRRLTSSDRGKRDHRPR